MNMDDEIEANNEALAAIKSKIEDSLDTFSVEGVIGKIDSIVQDGDATSEKLMKVIRSLADDGVFSSLAEGDDSNGEGLEWVNDVLSDTLIRVAPSTNYVEVLRMQQAV